MKTARDIPRKAAAFERTIFEAYFDAAPGYLEAEPSCGRIDGQRLEELDQFFVIERAVGDHPARLVLVGQAGLH